MLIQGGLMSQLRISILGFALLLCGCPVSATGFVDGQAVPLASGYYLEYGSGALILTMTGEPDACSNAAAAREVGSSATSNADIVDWIGQNRPANYWHWDIQAVTGETLEGASRSASPASDQWALGYAFHYLRHPTVDDLESGFGSYPADYLSAYVSSGGSLEITSHTPGEAIAGQFTTDIERFEDGAAGLFGIGEVAEAGSLAFSFNLAPCEALMAPSAARGTGGGGG